MTTQTEPGLDAAMLAAAPDDERYMVLTYACRCGSRWADGSGCLCGHMTGPGDECEVCALAALAGTGAA